MILVTGGAGFIGSNLVAALCDRGAEVVVCDRLGQGEQWRNIAKHAVVEIVDPRVLPAWLDGYGGAIETVFHMGATSSTVAADVDQLVENNFAFSMRLWRWCAAADKRLIYARSEEHTSELQSLMRNSYAVFCLKKKKYNSTVAHRTQQ